jgi:hypothetical protein
MRSVENANARQDAALLGAIPEHIAIGGLLKATPAEERGERFLYIEASNEGEDYQNEVVLAKALSASSDYYLRHGNVDISHYTVLGPKSGIANFLEYEIGRPLEVRVDRGNTFVKALLYRGDSPTARNATMVWDGLTKQQPPMRWYPSVGGSVLGKSIRVDPKTQRKQAVVDAVRWTNVALDRCPVNRSVPEVSTVPCGVFVKSMDAFVLVKGLEAGYGTDSAALTGGAALRRQSLHGSPMNYFVLRDQLAAAVLHKQLGAVPTAADLRSYVAHEYGLDADEAAEMVERFMRDLKDGLTNKGH